MRPNRYLAVAAVAVVASWLATIGLVYTSAADLRQQRAQYDELTQQLLGLEQMRASVIQLAAADDEFVMLSAFNGHDEARVRAQLARDHAAELASSKNNFANAFGRYQRLVNVNPVFNASAETETANLSQHFVDNVRRRYYSYIVASERLYLGNARFNPKIAGEAKSLEKALVRAIGTRIEEVKQQLGHHHPLFEATINDARDKLVVLLLGAIVPALVTGYLVRRGIIRMFGEISAQRESITGSNRKLEAALSELRRVQETMVQTERLSTLGKLTATVSHELRNPMAALRNSLFLIREFAGNPDKVNANVERAERSIVRCDNIIGDLLEYTRQRNLDLQPVSLAELTREILDEQKLPAEIKLTTDLRGGSTHAMIDSDRFRRVVINLVQNAAEAIRTSKGFGEIRAQTGLVGDMVFLEIADDGPGISEDVLEKIFEPLFTTKSFGAGLGLPTAKRLVEQHFGTLTVNSKPGMGSSFRVLLPLSKNNQVRAA
ncbi:MAG TPA: ATP-binding protein [Aestuariivirgaceae bacterium]|jgi:signal transduction histidine kinase